MIELPRHESARKRDVREVIPERVHAPGPHAAQRTSKSGDMVIHPFRPYLGNEGRAPALEAGEQRQAAPVLDERFETAVLDALCQSIVPEPASCSRLFLQARMGADGQEREDAFRPPCRDMQGEPTAHGGRRWYPGTVRGVLLREA